jgi:transposase InsO family protein
MDRITREEIISDIPVSLIKCPLCPQACEACLQGKLTRPRFGHGSHPVSTNLERIHLDTVGELPVQATTGERYWVTAVDEHSHFIAAMPVRAKSDIPRKVKELLIFWSNQLGLPVKCIRSDRGTEFINQELKTYLSAQGIKLETSAPGTPQ